MEVKNMTNTMGNYITGACTEYFDGCNTYHTFRVIAVINGEQFLIQTPEIAQGGNNQYWHEIKRQLIASELLTDKCPIDNYIEVVTVKRKKDMIQFLAGL